MTYNINEIMSHSQKKILIPIKPTPHKPTPPPPPPKPTPITKQPVPVTVPLQILTNVALVIPHMLMGDQIEAIPAVRYLRSLYPEVHVWSIKNNLEKVTLFYADDPAIKVFEVGDQWWGHSIFYKTHKLAQYLPDNVYPCGIHAKTIHKTPNFVYGPIPFGFYRHMKLPIDVYWNYFCINDSPMSETLYQLVQGTPYIFTHPATGYGPLFTIEDIDKHSQLSHHDILVIDPNQNRYPPDHKFYPIAQQLIGYKINDYVQVMIHADYLYLSDSSFFCLAMQLGILTDKCFVRSRADINYDYLWSIESCFFNQIGYGSDACKKRFQRF